MWLNGSVTTKRGAVSKIRASIFLFRPFIFKKIYVTILINSRDSCVPRDSFCRQKAGKLYDNRPGYLHSHVRGDASVFQMARLVCAGRRSMHGDFRRSSCGRGSSQYQLERDHDDRRNHGSGEPVCGDGNAVQAGGYDFKQGSERLLGRDCAVRLLRADLRFCGQCGDRADAGSGRA